MPVVKHPGTVTCFDPGSARGEVQYDHGGNRSMAEFLVSSFDAPRYPAAGDQVDVAVSEPAGRLLWLRLKE